MLWLKVKLGKSVYIGDCVLTLLAKNRCSITVDIDGEQHAVARNSCKEFPLFTLYTGERHGLRLGFEAAPEVQIRREGQV